jgi:hypothetical protein
MHTTTETLLDLGLGGNTWARRIAAEALAASTGPSEGHKRALEVLSEVSCADFTALATVAAREGIGYAGLKALLAEAQERCLDGWRGWWQLSEDSLTWVTCSGTTKVVLLADGSALFERQAPRWFSKGGLWETVWSPTAQWQIDPQGDIVAHGWSTLGRPELIELLAPLEPSSAEAFERKLDAAADKAVASRRREAAYWGPGPRERRGHRRGRKPRCPWRD